jgi:hypothetical protein
MCDCDDEGYEGCDEGRDEDEGEERRWRRGRR